MNISIIVHSQTGNTLSVAQKLKTRLEETGHFVSLSHIKDIDSKDTSNQQPGTIFLGDELPEKSDVLVLAGWVQAFSLCQGFSSFLNNWSTIKAHQTHVFVTHHFPYAWMGGNNAVSQIKSILSNQNITVSSSKVFNWSNKNNPKQIDLWVDETVKRIEGK
ncbi:MAG: flavodoxin family protein [Erysipelothrix sp.]|nr:flavodoxin family protein [Erysipelothrix sp.]